MSRAKPKWMGVPDSLLVAPRPLDDKDRAELLVILQRDDEEAHAFVSLVEEMIGYYVSMRRFESEEPTPAEVREALRELRDDATSLAKRLSLSTWSTKSALHLAIGDGSIEFVRNTVQSLERISAAAGSSLEKLKTKPGKRPSRARADLASAIAYHLWEHLGIKPTVYWNTDHGRESIYLAVLRFVLAQAEETPGDLARLARQGIRR